MLAWWSWAQLGNLGQEPAHPSTRVALPPPLSLYAPWWRPWSARPPPGPNALGRHDAPGSGVPFWANQGDHDLIIDEELPVVRYVAHRLPDTHDFITDLIEIDSINSAYGRVAVLDEEALEERGRNKGRDELLEVVAETLRILDNPHWETFVNLEKYEKLRTGRGKRLAFHSVLNPSVLEGFRSVFMAAANIEDTAVYKLWGDRDVTFVEDVAFGKALRFQVHPNGSLLDIRYTLDGAWSRKRATTSVTNTDGKCTRDMIIEGAKNLFGEEPFLWQINKAVSGNPFGPNATQLPNKPHGLNSYLAIDRIAFLSALNPPPDHFRFLATMGLGGEEVRKVDLLPSGLPVDHEDVLPGPQLRGPEDGARA